MRSSDLNTILARGAALLLGAGALTNIAADLVVDRFDANAWWIDLRAWPTWLGETTLVVGAVLLTAWALRPDAGPARRRATAGVALLLAAATVHNALVYWKLLSTEHLHAGAPIPFSLLPLSALLLVAWRAGIAGRRPQRAGLRPLAGAVVAAGLLGLVAAWLLMATYGASDYRREADAVVVFGARAYADGTPSLALHDRIRTATELVTGGYAGRLIASGGPGDGDHHETAVMRRFAERAGIPSDRILVDEGGLSTLHTVRNTTRLLDEIGAQRVLAVSHGYHLPRVRLAFARAGRQVYTVPAEPTRPLRRMPYYMAREMAALVVYWLRGAG